MSRRVRTRERRPGPRTAESATPALTPSWLRRLRETRARFGPAAARRKRALLRRGARESLGDPGVLRDYHDTLLFLIAYPDDASLRRRAQAELYRIARITRERRNGGSGRLPPAWRDSGIAGTTLTCGFSLELARWLCERFARDVTLVWRDESPAALDEVLRALVPRTEQDGLLETGLSTREWCQLARGVHRQELAWLLGLFAELPGPPALVDQLFEGLGLSQRWVLRHPLASRTFQRFPTRPICYQRRDLERVEAPLALLGRPVRLRRVLPRAEAHRVIDLARASLAVRRREIDPISYANPREVRCFPLDRGIDLALFGLTVERRLPVESYFGYVIAKNRVPAAYGGGWIFFDRAEIGFNVFETLRGGQSSLLFTQVLRVYRHVFGVRRFIVEPFQIGADNEEGIRSGAFWFYYRLGFRPEDSRLSELAAREWDRLAADRRHRTSLRTLRRLATARLTLDVAPPHRGCPDEPPDLVRVSLAVTHAVARRFDGDRTRAAAWAERRLLRVLGVRSMARWPAAERVTFRELGLLAALCPDLGAWRAAERRALLGLLRAKGAAQERPFARRLQRHRRLWRWLETLGARDEVGRASRQLRSVERGSAGRMWRAKASTTASGIS